MRKDVRKLVKKCETCLVSMSENVKYPGLLQPLVVLDSPWLDISMDFIEGLSLYNGFSIVFSVVDRLTKFAHFFPLSHPYTAVKVAQFFFQWGLQIAWLASLNSFRQRCSFH